VKPLRARKRAHSFYGRRPGRVQHAARRLLRRSLSRPRAATCSANAPVSIDLVAASLPRFLWGSGETTNPSTIYGQAFYNAS